MARIPESGERRPVPEQITEFDLSPSARLFAGDGERELLRGNSHRPQKHPPGGDPSVLLRSPSYLHAKRPEVEAQRLGQRWKHLLATRMDAAGASEVGKQKAAAAAHQLLLRTIAKTCKLKPFSKLLEDTADFYRGVFAEVFMAALSEKRLADDSLRKLKEHQKRQKAIIIRHVERQHMQQMRKFLQSALHGWHEETVGKKKRIEGLQKVFLGHSRKAVLKDVFRQWFTCVKNWLKARKTAQSNLLQIDGRHDAEVRLVSMQNELMVMESEVAQLNRTEDNMRTTAIRRVKQLKSSQLETTQLLEVVEACVFSTESDPVAFADACKHQPNENRIATVREAVESGKLRSVPKLVSVGTDMSDLIPKKIVTRPSTSVGVRSDEVGGGGLEYHETSRLLSRTIKAPRRVPELVQMLSEASSTHGSFVATGSCEYVLFV
jgi:hypothetical protein